MKKQFLKGSAIFVAIKHFFKTFYSNAQDRKGQGRVFIKTEHNSYFYFITRELCSFEFLFIFITKELCSFKFLFDW